MTPYLQPFLTDAALVLHAPTQVWSRRTGEIGAHPIDGVYHGDTRFIRSLTVRYDAYEPEWVSMGTASARDVRFDALLRRIDDDEPDPKVRLTRERTVHDGLIEERYTVRAHLTAPVRTVLAVRLEPDAAPLHQVKVGAAARQELHISREDSTVTVTVAAGGARMVLDAPGAEITEEGRDLVLRWQIEVAEGAPVTVGWRARLDDPSLVVRGAPPARPWALETAPGADPRLRHWLAQAQTDLDALRLTLPAHPGDEFVAAGAPWFFTLFGRDSLWAARMLLPVDPALAASTLRVLARLQGTEADARIAEEPGKILHELRAGSSAPPGAGMVLPPLYYGTVDATPLWVTLLAEAHAHGMPTDEVRALLPNLRAALDWLLGAADDDGFVDYLDETGHLSNQGWKDSGDSVQWRSGLLAEGPIALSEVQAYAYEAAIGAASLLDELGEDGGDVLRSWAAALRQRFRDRFWVTTPEGMYPAIALDRDGRPVDTLTSNAGHLLGTGLLDPDEETAVAVLLTGETMNSGFGLRTMSTGAAGYWPLSYHGGSVWAHDTAIVALGMFKAGLGDHARMLVDGLLAAAETFHYRMPELHAGDARTEAPRPAPYPAACRPQAWSAAAAVVCAQILAG